MTIRFVKQADFRFRRDGRDLLFIFRPGDVVALSDELAQGYLDDQVAVRHAKVEHALALAGEQR